MSTLDRETKKLKRKFTYKGVIEDSWNAYRKDIPNYIIFNEDTLEMKLKKGCQQLILNSNII